MKTSLFFSKLLVLFLMTTELFSQSGTVRGYMYDDGTGETILFGNVQVQETGTGTTSDLDGAYSIELEAGTYTLVFTYLGFSDLTVSDVEVKSGEITTLDIRLQEQSTMIQEVVITARQARNTEAALATIRKRSTNVLDGISSSSFKRIGDSDAASAVKRVPGVSIEGGKYVYVRGLGDRYTKTILNGIDIPGLDPDRNTLQMDLFPTNVVDNIIVLKTFTADLPADFTGGVVNINTKDFPESGSTTISAGIGYNPDMHFNDQYLTTEGSGSDWLGYDNGLRRIPTQKSSNIPTRVDVFGSRVQEARFSSILSRFNPTLAGYRTKSNMDYSFGLSFGNQINKKGYTIGYNFAGTYKNDTEFYQDAVNSRYGKGNTSDIFDLNRREYQIGDFGTNNVLLGGLAGLSLKSRTSKITLNALHLQNGESKVGQFEYTNNDQGANFNADQYNIEYSERSLSNLLLSGRHTLDDGDFIVNWKLSPTISKITDPDIRFTRIRNEGERLTIGTESGIPQRIWRYLDEVNLAGKIDLDKNYGFNNEKATLKIGGSYTYKQRDYDIQNFGIFPGNSEITSDLNSLLQEKNFFDRENLGGLYFNAQFIPRNVNKYQGNVGSIGAYISNEFSPFKKLKAVLGLRFESYLQKYSGLNQNGNQFDNEIVIDNDNIFPTANLIYSVTENTNLRASVTRTIARPSFKEASFATIIDPISGRTFIGGFFPDIDVATGEQIWDGNLQSTNITNMDLRYEFFQTGGQNISLSTFYKGFDNPIEIVQYVQASNNFQPRNVGDGRVLGVEFEFRKNLGSVESSNFTVNGNITVTKSQIEMSETEFRSRLANARDGEEIDNKRDMAGQAPYIINGGLMYSNNSRTFDLGLFYNVQGRTLQFVGIADRPDIYSRPFNSLNFTSSYDMGANDQATISMKVDNILGSKRESVFESFNTDDALFTSLSPQRTFSLSLSYKL